MRYEERSGTKTPEVGDGETMGCLEANAQGAPAATATFSELEGNSAMLSGVEM